MIPWFPPADSMADHAPTDEPKHEGEDDYVDESVQKFSDKALSEFFTAFPRTHSRLIPATLFFLHSGTMWNCESLQILMLKIRLVHVTQLGLAAKKIRLAFSRDRVSVFAPVVPYRATDFTPMSDAIVIKTIPLHTTDLYMMRDQGVKDFAYVIKKLAVPVLYVKSFYHPDEHEEPLSDD